MSQDQNFPPRPGGPIPSLTKDQDPGQYQRHDQGHDQGFNQGYPQAPWPGPREQWPPSPQGQAPPQAWGQGSWPPGSEIIGQEEFHPESEIRSARFRRGREESWRRLETLVTKLEKKGLDSLTGKEAIDLPMLYQAEVSSLAVARSTILDRSLVDYLEALSLRAYLMVYGPRTSLLELALKFFKTGLPRAFWTLKFHILIAFFILFSSTLAGYVAVVIDHDNYELFISKNVYDDRDFSASSEKLAKYLHGNWEGLQQALVHFANFLFRHNTQIAIFCFSLGVFLGVPTVLLLIYNGLTLGAMIGLHFEKGLGLDFLGWVSIHGVTELSAIVLAGGAGLSLAEKILVPGPGGRLENLGKRGQDAATLMIGVVFMLLCAGILEGCFRQLIDNTASRLIVASLTAIFWGVFFLRGRLIAPD